MVLVLAVVRGPHPVLVAGVHIENTAASAGMAHVAARFDQTNRFPDSKPSLKTSWVIPVPVTANRHVMTAMILGIDASRMTTQYRCYEM